MRSKLSYISRCSCQQLIIPCYHSLYSHYKQHFLEIAPPGLVVAVNFSRSMNEKLFLTFLNHLVATVKGTRLKPVLLLLDSHDSHFSTAALNDTKENGVLMFSFPPHCSHKFQQHEKIYKYYLHSMDIVKP